MVCWIQGLMAQIINERLHWRRCLSSMFFFLAGCQELTTSQCPDGCLGTWVGITLGTFGNREEDKRTPMVKRSHGLVVGVVAESLYINGCIVLMIRGWQVGANLYTSPMRATLWVFIQKRFVAGVIRYSRRIQSSTGITLLPLQSQVKCKRHGEC